MMNVCTLGGYAPYTEHQNTTTQRSPVTGADPGLYENIRGYRYMYITCNVYTKLR